MRKVKSKPLTKRTNASLSITNHAAQREKQIEKRERERERLEREKKTLEGYSGVSGVVVILI